MEDIINSPIQISSLQFRSVRERPKPRYPLLSDSSSCGGDDNSSEHNHNASSTSEDAIEAAADRVRRLDLDQRREDTAKGVVAGPWEPCQSGQSEDQADGKDSEEVVREKVKKKSFWQKLLGKKSNKESGSS